MRTAPAAAVLLALLALAAPAAALGLDEADGGLALVAFPFAAPADAPAAPITGEPSDVPEVTGASNIVGRAAALASALLAPADLETIAAEQHLRAALEPSEFIGWRLGRFVPPVPPLPATSVVGLSPVEPLVARPAGTAAVAVAAVGLVSLAFPKVPLLPLYSRIQREEAMLNSRRSQLYELVRAEPGIHLSDLVRRSGLGWGAALYHLGVLEKARVLVVHAEGGFKRYFANGLHHKQEQHRLVALRHEAAKALFDAVQVGPGRSGRELASALNLSPSTLARASERLEEAGLVRRLRAGRRVLYFPAEPALAAPPLALAA